MVVLTMYYIFMRCHFIVLILYGWFFSDTRAYHSARGEECSVGITKRTVLSLGVFAGPSEWRSAGLSTAWMELHSYVGM